MDGIKAAMEAHGVKMTLTRPDGRTVAVTGFIYPVTVEKEPYEMTRLGDTHKGTYCFILPWEACIADERRTTIACELGEFQVVSAETIYALGKPDHIEATAVRKAGCVV
ncbi:MAG: hypothetical protein IJ072_03295 [Oscillospiraceae bacterium]|nr:hypothetical protein [Oscillospiraceae bacterium]